MGTNAPPYRDLDGYLHLLALAAILGVAAWVGFLSGWEITTVFLVLVLLLAVFAVVAGHGATRYWRGILIDGRNKLSLSRLQMLVWTVLVLSGIAAAVIQNLRLGLPAPLGVAVPSELWVLMGISTASLVASPAILSSKGTKTVPNERQEAAVMNELWDQGAREAVANSVIVENETPSGARWGDLLKGEEVGNAANVDLGKLQMFLFTFILSLSYGAAIFESLAEGVGVLGLPEVEHGMNVLLGISHTGYLAAKTVTHTPEARPMTEAERSGSRRRAEPTP